VACLRAVWCHVRTDYRPVFDAVVGASAAHGPLRTARWIDIEDEDALVGAVDVETFPTLPVCDGPRVLLFGPLTPQPETLRRLLATLVERPGALSDVPAAVQALATRLPAAENATPGGQASGAMPSA
jgi:hypothetical protein